MERDEFVKRFVNGEKLVLELGCGPYKKDANSVGIDIFEADGVDVIADLNQGLPFIPDNSVDKIVSRHFLEHIENVEFLIKEIHRVLKPLGVKEAVVPHHSNPFYYSDLTHRHFFGLYTFDYFATPNTQLRRKVPAFYNDIKFDVEVRRFEFRSKFLLINFNRRIMTRIINSSSWLQEFYEGVLSNRMPCNEIKFILRKPLGNGEK